MNPLTKNVLQSLTVLGWSTPSDGEKSAPISVVKVGTCGIRLSAALEKYWETAVGKKSALVWIRELDTGEVQLSAEYWSEGRNILSTIFATIPVGVTRTDVDNKIREMNARLNKAVDESYARRLFLRFGMRQQPVTVLFDSSPV